MKFCQQLFLSTVSDCNLPDKIIEFASEFKPLDFSIQWFERRKHLITSIAFAGKFNHFDRKGKLTLNSDINTNPRFKYKLSIEIEGKETESVFN